MNRWPDYARTTRKCQVTDLPIHSKQARIAAMNDSLALLDLVRTRRSIRRYTHQPVDRALIEAALEAATHAPSAHNRQPWRFAVVASPEAKERLGSAMGERLRADRLADGDSSERVEADAARSRARITTAPVVVLACLTMTDMDRYSDARRGSAERSMAIQSTAAAIQNFLLAAHAQGLAACWMCAPLFAPDAARDALALPADWEPQALITLGYPAEPPKPKTVAPLDSRVVYR
jgi:coenzyme F420-0:L-glutamate ligase/coenzyme F420-1:gamma-L-glutamate ligase